MPDQFLIVQDSCPCMADRQNNVKALISLTIFKNDKDLGSFTAAFFG
jgi:hypothetical protein